MIIFQIYWHSVSLFSFDYQVITAAKLDTYRDPHDVVASANIHSYQTDTNLNITLRPRQDGRHFPDDIFKWIFLKENVWIPIKISLKIVPKGPSNNIPAVVQIMAWCWPGDKPLSEPMVVSFWRIYASLGLNELLRSFISIEVETRLQTL